MLRREISGFHYYERQSGLHLLFDEAKVAREDAINRGPRHLSLMLTRSCNLNCPFCYVEKGEREASFDLLIAICEAAKELQVLDITLGGGEPTLHSSFGEFISHAWTTYPYGISVTTNAIDITPLIDVAGMLSSVRISTDNTMRPVTAKFAGRIEKIAAVHKVGANILYSPSSSRWVRDTIRLLATLGTRDFLIIPQHDSGQYVINENDWREMDGIVRDLNEKYQIMVTSDATPRITSPLLATYCESEYLFAHIDESGNIRERSWGPSFVKARTQNEIMHGLLQLNPLRRNNNEDMD